MPILRDIYCVECGIIEIDVYEDPGMLPCNECRMITKHDIVCNGGTGHRYRQQDWPDARINPEFYHGQTTSKIEAITIDDNGNELPVTHFQDGHVLHDKYTGDYAEENKDRNYHRMLKEAGKTRIYIDGRRNNHVNG